LLRASAVAFLVLKIVGALYLVWLGVQLLRAHAVLVDRRVARKAYRQGLLSNLVLRRPAIRRALDRFTGAVLVALGIRLAFESR
jgi:threonine/homoserine/homoserine lactone efflux protein